MPRTESTSASSLEEDARDWDTHHVEEDLTQLRGGESPASPVSDALAPNVLKTRFVLETLLGSGGMGTVYRAKDLRKVEARDSQPYLAIKVLNRDFREHPDALIALQREAVKSQSLAHPNIVKIFDFDKDGDLPFMTMELLQGDELDTLLRRFPQGLPDSLAWPVIRGFCSALKHAHAEGVVHADLKPGNLFVTSAGSLKIFDFGLARAVQSNLGSADLSHASPVEALVFDAAALGGLTPAYASRSVLDGNAPGISDDLFAAAIVIYQILTGKHPYNRIPADKVDSRGGGPERPKRLSARGWGALSSALMLEEQDRRTSVAQLYSALFEKSPWRMRLMAASMTVVLASGLAVYLQNDGQIMEVRQQAVQAGKLEAVASRLHELTEESHLDANWEARLDGELQRLSSLDNSTSLLQQNKTKIADRYRQQGIAAQDIEQAKALALRGERFGNMSEVWDSLESRYRILIRDQIDHATPSIGWLSSTESYIGALLEIAPNSHAVALTLTEVNATYVSLLEALGTEVPSEVSVEALRALTAREFDQDRVDEGRRALVRRHQTTARAEQRDLVVAQTTAFGSSFVEQGCLESELGELRQQYSSLVNQPGVSRSRLVERLDLLFAGCVRQLRPLEPDAAARLQQAAVEDFGSLPVTQSVRVDPCDRPYLLGAGARGGRGGTCVDAGAGRPVMVVIPMGRGALAVSRYEVSRAEFQTYCQASQAVGCPAVVMTEQARLPLTLIEAEDAMAYADWLSQQTGFRYRLPSVEEWTALARVGQEAPDANRNCRVALGGVSRGGSAIAAHVGAPNAYGVVNVFGNVAEWATDGDRLRSMGGHFDDSLGDCVSSNQPNSTGDSAPTQGIRLVRQVGSYGAGL